MADAWPASKATASTYDNSLSNRLSFLLLYAPVHVTWFKIIKMLWQSADGPTVQMRLLHSLAIP
ncbi:unnamed protein product, partial [Sphagnum tenellum]